MNKAGSSEPNSKDITPAFAAGLKRSGKPVRQHAFVRAYWLDKFHSIECSAYASYQPQLITAYL